MNNNIRFSGTFRTYYVEEKKKFEKIEGESFRFSSQTSQNTYFAQ